MRTFRIEKSLLMKVLISPSHDLYQVNALFTRFSHPGGDGCAALVAIFRVRGQGKQAWGEYASCADPSMR